MLYTNFISTKILACHKTRNTFNKTRCLGAWRGKSPRNWRYRIPGALPCIICTAQVRAYQKKHSGPTVTANTHLGDLARFPDGVNAHAHLLNVIEAVEYAEHIDSVLGRQPHEFRHHVVRVRRVAYGVGPADEHLRMRSCHAFMHAAARHDRRNRQKKPP